MLCQNNGWDLTGTGWALEMPLQSPALRFWSTGSLSVCCSFSGAALELHFLTKVFANALFVYWSFLATSPNLLFGVNIHGILNFSGQNQAFWRCCLVFLINCSVHFWLEAEKRVVSDMYLVILWTFYRWAFNRWQNFPSVSSWLFVVFFFFNHKMVLAFLWAFSTSVKITSSMHLRSKMYFGD